MCSGAGHVELRRGVVAVELRDERHAGLLTAGLDILDAYVPPARVRQLIECARLRRSQGEFVAAQVGADGQRQRRPEIRSDSTCWLAEPLYPPEQALLADLEQLRLHLNVTGYLGLLDVELHYAWYPPGLGYVRHVDQDRKSVV